MTDRHVDTRSPGIMLRVLGPSTTWLLRRGVAGLDREPDGYPISLADTARSHGLSDLFGRSSPVVRAVSRTIKFQLAVPEGPNILAVRRRAPRSSPARSRTFRRSCSRPTYAGRRNSCGPRGDLARRRGRLLALSVIEMGEDLESAKRRLLVLRYHLALAQEAATWEWGRHRAALNSAS